MAEPRQPFQDFLERSGKSITRCAFILLYVALVVSSYAILHTTQHIAFGVSLYMVASGVLFGIFVFACAGTSTKLCEWFRFGCSLMLALALTFFILVSGGAAVSVTNPPPQKTTQTTPNDTPEVPLSGLVVNCAIVASIGLFVVIVILLPVLAPMGVTREPDRMTIQMTAVYANFARSGIGSNPTFLMTNGSGPPGTETLLLYSRVRGHPPTYEESQIRDEMKRATSRTARKTKAPPKAVLVFPSSSADNSLERRNIPSGPPPTYEELYGRRSLQGSSADVHWDPAHQTISIEGLFPPSYEESLDVEDVEYVWRYSDPYGPSTSRGTGSNYYVPNSYYAHKTTVSRTSTIPRTLVDEKIQQPQVVPWRTRSFLDSSDTDDTTSRSGTLRRSPCGTLHHQSPTETMSNSHNPIAYGSNYIRESPSYHQQNATYHATYYASQRSAGACGSHTSYTQYQTRTNPAVYNGDFHAEGNLHELVSQQNSPAFYGIPRQGYSYNQTLPARSASFVDTRYPPGPIGASGVGYRSATMRPDWGRYNRIRSFLDSSDTSTEDGPDIHPTTTISQRRTAAIVGYRTYHHGARPYTTLRRQCAADYEYQWASRPNQHAGNVNGASLVGGYYTTDRRFPHRARRPLRSLSACGCPHGTANTTNVSQETALDETGPHPSTSGTSTPYCVSSTLSIEMPNS